LAGRSQRRKRRKQARKEKHQNAITHERYNPRENMHIANMRIFVTRAHILNRIYRIDLFKMHVFNPIKIKLLKIYS